LAHVFGDRAGDQQHVGMPGRCHETQPESLEIVERVVERVNLELAPIARPGIDLADREAAPQALPRGALDARRELGERRFVLVRRRFRQGAAKEALEQGSAHARSPYRSCPEYEQLNDLLQSGKSATMLPSITASNSGHWNQEGSRKWQRATRSPSSLTQTSTSPRNASVIATPSRTAPERSISVWIEPSGRCRKICAIIARLCSTSRTRIQTRALTSPASSTGTSNSSAS